MSTLNYDNYPVYSDCLEELHHGHACVVIYGAAGSGKSTLVRKYIAELMPMLSKGELAVLAPTGVAAQNIGGQTIHSFCGLSEATGVEDWEPDEKVLRTIASTRVVILDEISMVRAELLDCLDLALRRAIDLHTPFGGCRVIAVGDMAQLAPVVQAGAEYHAFNGGYYNTPYYFSAHCWGEVQPSIYHLNHNFRQESDGDLAEFLNAIRDKSVTIEHLRWFNSLVVRPPVDQNTPHVVMTNKAADSVNYQRLRQLSTEVHEFEGESKGVFPHKPAPQELHIAQGARVMLVQNNKRAGYINGDFGTIKTIKPFVNEKGRPSALITVTLDKTQHVVTYEVPRALWTNSQFYAGDDPSEMATSLMTKKLGTYSQYPLRLGYAMTAHKVQGATFDTAHIVWGPAGRGTFATGQAYVALSRCRSLEGLSMNRPLTSADIKVDHRVFEG